jgi:molybdopterin synthase catalytic subunit
VPDSRRFAFALHAQPLDPGLAASQVPSSADGAVVVFLGIVREESRGRRVVRLEYEAYGSMAEAEMARIFAEMAERFGVERARVDHRVGICGIGDPSVAIAVAAPHRAAAFDACRYCIDELKKRVPIWKKEVYEGGAEWIGERS